MDSGLQNVLPADIERRSMEIISETLIERDITLDPEKAAVIKRVIHTTADFDYAESLVFSPGVMDIAADALRGGAAIVTDTQMARAGINKAALSSLGGEVFCFMSDSDVAEAAKQNGTTRATACMDKALTLERPLIFVIGNAPTALIRLNELIEEKRLTPALIIGVPVGFVNVVEAKELITRSGAPHIVARGRKGGSNVAAAIVNAIVYGITRG